MSRQVDPKVLPEDLESLGFSPSLAKPEVVKEVERQRTRSPTDRAKWVRVTRRGKRNLAEEKWNRGRREAADDGATGRSVKKL